MEKSIFMLAFLICSLSVAGQKIIYESSFEKAKRLALEQNKPLAVLITIKPPVYSPNYMTGLNDQKVIELFNKSFINFKTEMEDTAASGKIIKEFRIYRFPSFAFFDAKGGLLFTDIAFLSRSKPILEIAQRALLATKEKSLVDYDSAYAAGEKSPEFLKEYILRREKAGIKTNAELIEKYALGLKVSDLDNYNEVLFILKAGPISDGKAYKLASLNKNIIDSIFKTEPLADRVAINNTIIANTLSSAITDKNYSRAMAAANFARGTWTNNTYEGQKSWTRNIMNYYLGIKDTTKYLQQASSYYEQYYMRLTVDSIRRSDSLNMVNTRKRMQQAMIDTSAVQTISFSYEKDKYATELNNAAWTFYQLAIGRDDYLFKAMLWSRRSIELSQKPAFYDTYAHLLYRLNLFDEAESMQKKAIERAISEKMDSKLYQREFEKIKGRTL